MYHMKKHVKLHVLFLPGDTTALDGHGFVRQFKNKRVRDTRGSSKLLQIKHVKMILY